MRFSPAVHTSHDSVVFMVRSHLFSFKFPESPSKCHDLAGFRQISMYFLQFLEKCHVPVRSHFFLVTFGLVMSTHPPPSSFYGLLLFLMLASHRQKMVKE